MYVVICHHDTHFESSDSKSPPTWREVVVAIAKKSGGENPAEAERIAKLFEDHGEPNKRTSHVSSSV